MRAKICGITNLQDALVALHAGAWALGFIFHSASPRYIDKARAKYIIENLPSPIIKIGIFIDKSELQIIQIMEEIGLDFAQIYQDGLFSESMKKKMILSLQPNTLDDLPEDAILNQYGYIMLDAPRTAQGLYGGTGQKAQWDIACELAKKYHLILAGGLHPENVQSAFKSVQPFAVDVASGTEISPGIKSPKLVQQFLQKVQNEN